MTSKRTARGLAGKAVLTAALLLCAAPESLAQGGAAGQAQGAAYNWTGPHFGLHVGAVIGPDVDLGTTTLSGGISAADPLSFTGKANHGILGGIHAGYDFQRGSPLVLGVEGDISSASLDQTSSARRSQFGVPLPPNNIDDIGVRTEWLASVRGRIGYAWDRTLVYGTGGAAWAEMHYSAVRNFQAAAPNNRVNFDDIKSGWVAGGGVERATKGNLTFRLEYLHYEIDSSASAVATCVQNLPAGAFCGATPPVVPYNWGDASFDVVRAGVGVRF